MQSEPTPTGLALRFVDGWPLDMTADPKIRDLDLAEKLGYERPRDIRELIARMVKAEKIQAADVRRTVRRTSMPNGGEREDVVAETWLTLHEALLVTTQSETASAWGMTREIVRVFLLAAAGQLPGQALTHASALNFLVNEALASGRNGAAVAYINAARNVEKGEPEQLSLDMAEPAARAPADWMADLGARILATLAKGPVRTRRVAVCAIKANYSRAYKAFGQLVAEGRVVATKDEQGRLVYSVAAPAEGVH